MASWMVHFRVADGILSTCDRLSSLEFIFGNIAPDSGVPNEDWSVFTPSTDISHFKIPRSDGKMVIAPEKFASKYLTKDKLCTYTPEERSFYLGYLSHLLTDLLWIEKVFDPTARRDPEYSDTNRACVQKWKEDWYDLDFLYLRENPNFNVFLQYRAAEGFENRFMEEFAPDAFDNRRAYICEFYLENKSGLDREYPYLTREQMDDFVAQASEHLCKILTPLL